MTAAHLTLSLAAPSPPRTDARVRSFPGEARQVRAARQFAGQALAGCPARESLLVCVSELAANAIEHTDSGAGGTFTVAVGRPRDGAAFVAVTDEGGAGEPVAGAVLDGTDGELPEAGRGLALVAAVSSRWGSRRIARGRVVWAEATWPVPVRGPGGARTDVADLWPVAWTTPVEPQGAA